MGYEGTPEYTIPFPISFMNDMTGIGGIDYSGVLNNGIVFRIHPSTTNSLLVIQGRRFLSSGDSTNHVYGKFIIIGY